jgi:hypothetical protein
VHGALSWDEAHQVSTLRTPICHTFERRFRVHNVGLLQAEPVSDAKACPDVGRITEGHSVQELEGGNKDCE